MEFFKKRSAPESTPHEPTLPSDVRYALQYREALLGKNEIIDLANNHFEREALYLVLKAVVADPVLQQAILQRVVDAILKSGDDEREDALKACALGAVAMLPPDTQVLGDKLAQLSRQGVRHWQSLYADAAKRYVQTDITPFLVGHATLVGVDAFIHTYGDAGKPLYILIPTLFDDDTATQAGYSIADGKVQTLSKDFERPANGLIIDDTKNTGASLEKVQRFWIADGVYQNPQAAWLSETT